VKLFEHVRHERDVIAHKRAAAGTLNDGGFVVEVTGAYVKGLDAFARGLIEDTFALVKRSGLPITDVVAAWMTTQLVPYIEIGGKQIREEAGQGRVLTDELRVSVDRAIDKSTAEIKRDLQIELELALIEAPAAVVVADEALLDTLVPLQNRRGFEKTFAECTRNSDHPVCLVLFDIDHFKNVNDKYGGHATGDEALKGC
jgi:diguanylate cyclase with GGDEF domain